MKPQDFRNCSGPWCLQHLSFFTKYLNLVNLIPVTLTKKHKVDFDSQADESKIKAEIAIMFHALCFQHICEAT